MCKSNPTNTVGDSNVQARLAAGHFEGLQRNHIWLRRRENVLFSAMSRRWGICGMKNLKGLPRSSWPNIAGCRNASPPFRSICSCTLSRPTCFLRYHVSNGQEDSSSSPEYTLGPSCPTSSFTSSYFRSAVSGSLINISSFHCFACCNNAILYCCASPPSLCIVAVSNFSMSLCQLLSRKRLPRLCPERHLLRACMFLYGVKRSCTGFRMVTCSKPWFWVARNIKERHRSMLHASKL